jgi:hypothetical protein
MEENILRFGLLVTCDQGIGLVESIKRAVGPGNIGNISPEITRGCFTLKRTGRPSVKVQVIPLLHGETSEEATERLVVAGHTLGSIGDLAGLLRDHPGEVAKWLWVLAIGEDSRCAGQGGSLCVPCARVHGAYRDFNLLDFRGRLDSDDGVLVLCE